MSNVKQNGRTAAPLVSIVVPVFNAARWLTDTLESFERQSYPNCEWVLVDDGSTDASLSIIENWQPEHGAAKVVRKKNGGASSARNAGLREATGDYVIFWDSDDTQNPEMLKKMVASVQQGADIAICAIKRIESDGRTRDMFTCEPQTVDSATAIRRWFEHGLSSGPYTKLIDRSLLLEHGIEFIEGEINEDIIWTAEILLAARSIALLGEPLYSYISREGSVTNTLDERHLIVFKNAQRLRNLICEELPGLSRECEECCARQVLSTTFLLLCRNNNSASSALSVRVARLYRQWLPEVASLCKKPKDLVKRGLITIRLLYLRQRK
ncbi:glycosyltransferase [Collinsella tanakaei]|nr:glycosyltransferase [Collinsella tanakaei]